MSNLDDIFDLPNGTEQVEKQEKKQRKKVEMTDEKRTAMLERLKAGREKRAENLKAKTELKEPKEPKKPKEVKSKETKEEVKEVIKKTNEDERLSFIKMMAGKSKPIDASAIVRPKKKVYKEESPVSIAKPDEVKKIDSKDQEKVVKVVTPPPVVPTNLTIVREPVIIRTFKKPIWA
jgi:hypothetical protein